MSNPSASRFSLTADLLYPAALGAGIAWWCEGVIGWRAHETPDSLASWAILFGLFFIVYHARSFLVLREEYGGKNHSRYYATTFTKDAIDCVALVAAFMCLRFPGGHIRLADPVGIYFMALLIPASALITDARTERVSWIMRLFACIPPLVGILMTPLADSQRFAPHWVDWAILVCLWLLLLTYLIKPKRFGVRSFDEVPESETKGPRRAFRIGGAVALAIILLAIVTWRVKEEVPSVDAGRSHGLEIDAPRLDRSAREILPRGLGWYHR
jgi:hypothetical protein